MLDKGFILLKKDMMKGDAKGTEIRIRYIHSILKTSFAKNFQIEELDELYIQRVETGKKTEYAVPD